MLAVTYSWTHMYCSAIRHEDKGFRPPRLSPQGAISGVIKYGPFSPLKVRERYYALRLSKNLLNPSSIGTLGVQPSISFIFWLLYRVFFQVAAHSRRVKTGGSWPFAH